MLFIKNIYRGYIVDFSQKWHGEGVLAFKMKKWTVSKRFVVCTCKADGNFLT